jgi:hypothetical protein
MGSALRVVRATVGDGRAIALLKARAICVSAAGYYSASALEAWASSVTVEAIERAVPTTTAYVAVTDSGVRWLLKLDRPRRSTSYTCVRIAGAVAWLDCSTGMSRRQPWIAASNV